MKLIIDTSEEDLDCIKYLKAKGWASRHELQILNGTPLDDVLDKIRTEIKALIEWHDCPIEYDNGNDAWYCEACNQVLNIIDKYKAESEGKGKG